MRRAALTLAVLTSAVALPWAAADASAPATKRLSNERTMTRWATPASAAAIRARPDSDAKRVAALHFHTADGTAEVYVALASREVDGREWVHIRVPGRPNGRTGWVPRSALGPLHEVTTSFVVNRRTLRATLRRAGKVVWTSRVGIGAPGTPTPAGRFYVRQSMPASGGVYGPWAFGTSAYSVLSDWPGGGVIGIHGTNEPNRIPGRPSHGCIRVPNHKILRLRKLMPIGTPVRIV